MKISLEKFDKIDFNTDYIKYSKKQMKDIKAHLEKLFSEYNTFKKQIFNYFTNFEACFPDLLKEVDSCITWLEYTRNFNDKKIQNINKNESFIKNISHKFEKCYNFINIINESDYISKLNKLNKKLLKSIKGISGFYPPKCGSLVGNSILNLIFKDMTISISESESEYENPNNYIK